MQPPKSYVRTDEHGVMRVGETRVMLDSVVAAFQQGHSPETIQQQYPALSLEQVYGVIAHYLANRELVDRYLERQGEVWKHWREKAAERTSPVVQRLRGQAAEVSGGDLDANGWPKGFLERVAGSMPELQRAPQGHFEERLSLE